MNIPINQEEANLIHYALEAMAFKRAEMAAEGMRSSSSLDRSIAASNERDAKTCYRLADLFRTEPIDYGQLPPMTKPIYEASTKERLKHIIRSCQGALSCFNDDVLRDFTPEELATFGLESDEIAVGDWIIRPRFRNRKP